MMASLFHASLILLSLIPTLFCFEGRDFVFNSDPPDRYNPPRALLSGSNGETFSQLPAEAFTFCFYADFMKHDKSTTLVSYSSRATGSANELYLETTFGDDSYMALSINGQAAIFHTTPDPGEWAHICSSWSSSSGNVHLFLNGNEVNGNNTEVQKGKKIGGDGIFVLGQDQDAFNDGYDATEGVEGRMTQFHLWDRKLTEAEVKEVKENARSGEVIAWANSSWQFSGGIMIEKSTNPVSIICGKEPVKKQCNGPVTTSFMDGKDLNIRYPVTYMAYLVIPEMNNVSVCMWVFLATNVDSCYDLIGGIVTVRVCDDKITFITVGKTTITLNVPFGHGNWTHTCLTSTTEGFIKIYKNAELLTEESNITKDLHVESNVISIYQKQSAPLDENEPIKGFKQKTTDVNMWNKYLSEDTVREAYCGHVQGNILNKNTAWDEPDPMDEIKY